MNSDYNSQVKGIVESLFDVCDQLDERGIARQIKSSDNEKLKETVKTEILLFIFKVLGDERQLNDETLNYINYCLDYNYTMKEIEGVRKQIVDSSIPQMSIMLPSFIIVDSYMGSNMLSTVYIKTIDFVMTGVFNCIGADLWETVSYCRRLMIYAEMVKGCLEYDLDFDPMEHIDEENKIIVEAAIKVDEVVNSYEAEKQYLEMSIKAVKESIQKENGERIVLPENIASSNSGKDSGINQLNKLIGLGEVKEQIQTVLNVHKVNKQCKEYGIERRSIGMHMVFTGNPGTGKTTVARIVGKLYHEEGLLSTGQFIEVSRADLVGKYVGHTAQMVKDVIKRAKGGVLFIDEAYTLSGDDNDFGIEAIDMLVKEMEDYRDDLVVIVAGYPALMYQFMESNPGLKSRFPITVEFSDYSVDELLDIYKLFCSENSIDAGPEVLEKVKWAFKTEAAKKKQNFGNARMVRNYFEKMIMNQANRLVREHKLNANDMTTFTIEDIPKGPINKINKLDNKNDFHVV